jgi:hypothetical protein
MRHVSITKYVSVLSLFCSFTNFVPISVTISAFAFIFYPFTFAATGCSGPWFRCSRSSSMP